MLRKLSQTFRCARHVPARQLGRRLFLNLKRQAFQRVPPRTRRNQTAPKLCGSLPKRNFRANAELGMEVAEECWSRQLNCAIRLSTPIAWANPVAVPMDSGDRYPRVNEGRESTHLERLTLHYHEYLESFSTAAGQRMITDWIENNPPYVHGYWLDSWNSYGLSIRCVEWMQWLASRRDALDDSFVQMMTHSIAEQMEFLLSNLETDICGNHLIKNIRCLLWIAACFDSPQTQRWHDTGMRYLHKELQRQVLSDGMHYELSPAYHCQVLGDLLDCLSVIPATEQNFLRVRLAEMVSTLAVLTHPDGLISLFSDGGLHMVHLPDQILEVCKKLEIQNSNLPDKQLKSAGYFRFANEVQWLLIDCGRVCEGSLPAHGHGDMLSFEWDVHGQRIFVDQGVYRYQGQERIFDRSSHSHNTFSIEGQDQAEFVGSFRTGRSGQATLDSLRSAAEQFLLEGSHAAYSIGNNEIVHSRQFEAQRHGLAIRDSIRCPSTAVKSYVRFLLHNECQVEQTSSNTLRIQRGDTCVRFEASRDVRLKKTHWSPEFGSKVPTHRIEVSLDSLPNEVDFNLEVED